MHKFTKHHCGGKEEVIKVMCIVFRQSDVLGLCDGGELKAQMLNSTPMPKISTNVELSTEAPLSQNPC